MRVNQVHIEQHLVRLFGSRSSLELEAPFEGVVRLRHAPVSSEVCFGHPRLPEKRSFAVLPYERASLAAAPLEGGAGTRVDAAGLLIELTHGRLSWRVMDYGGRALVTCEHVEGESAVGYPLPAHRTALELRAPPGEAYLGFGEKVGPLDKRGMRLVFWNTDEMPHHPDTDPLYVSIPFFIALRDGQAWGFFLDEPWRSEVDVALSQPEVLRWESTGPELDVYIVAGPRPADVLRRFTQLTGRAPLPPLWSLGAHQSRWGYQSAEEVRAVVDGYRAHGLALDCVHLDIDHQEGYRSLTWDRTRFPNPRALAADALGAGVRLVPIVDPALEAKAGNPLYEQALAGDFLVRTDRGQVLLGEVWPTPAAFPDHTREEVQRWWAEALRPFVEDGMAGIWNDMNEPSSFRLQTKVALEMHDMPARDTLATRGKTLPDYARHGTRRHLEVHNVYGLGMCRGTHEGLAMHAPERRPFVLSRAGYAGIQRYAALWTGDNSSHFGHLELSIPMLLGLSISGVGFVGADIPGFLGRPSPELMTRWMQLGVFYPLMRNHSAKGGPFQEPWRYGEPTLTYAREALARRYRLLPLLYTLMEEASRTGSPPLRPLCFEFPEDARALMEIDQLMFGRALLVAPVVSALKDRRLVYLPRGRWLSWPSLADPGEVIDGGRHVVAAAPLPVTPIYLAEGEAVPLTAPALHTTSANWSSLEWHLLAAPWMAGTLYEDYGDGSGPARSTRLSGEWSGDRLTLRCERSARARDGEGEGELPRARSEETVVLYGLPLPRLVEGAKGHARTEAGALRLELDASWTRVDIEL